MINKNIRRIISEIPENVKLVAISKTKSAKDIMLAYDTGQRVFGENKIQEMSEKHEYLPKEIIYSNEYKDMRNVKIKGLMAMGSNTNKNSILRTEFAHAKKIFDEINNKDKSFDILSLGMSNDYKIAIEFGSTMIRLGSLIFGERN